METALHAIGQTIALLGPNHHDPRLQPNGKLIFVLKCQFQSYAKEDPPPNCVKPLPAKLIKLAVQAYCASNMAKYTCMANMITIGFFFLCCLGEHTVTFDNESFELSYVQFYKDKKPVPLQSSKLLHTADSFNPHLWHTNELHKGKCIGHVHSTLAKLCPILAVAHWVAHLNLHKAKPHQPLYSYFHSASSSYCYLASQDITQVLQASALHHPCFCVNPASIGCCSLYTCCTMALFTCRVDTLLIKLVGCWHFDAMLHYLDI